MTQQRGAASGLSGLSQGMSQMEFSQDGMSQMMRGSSQMGHDGMLSQDSTYQGDRHHSTNEGFLSQLWKNGIFDWWNQSYWRILNCVAPHGFLISALEMVYQKNNCGVPKKNQRVSKMFLQEKLRKNGKKITVTFKKRKWIILVNFWVNTE